MDDESTTRYPSYGTSGDEYIHHTMRINAEDLEDDVILPGEEDVVSNFEFNQTVIASCPICGSDIRAKLVDKGSNGLIGDIKITLRIVSKTCECPKVYLLYDDKF